MLWTIFMLITLGGTLGWLDSTIIKKRGTKILPSIAIGAAAALGGGFVAYSYDLAGYGYYAALVAIGVLYLLDIFIIRKK